MEDNKRISGFSKLSKRGKIKWLVENFFVDPHGVKRELMSYWHSNEDQQKILDGFSENTISNFPMPFGVAPNFVIDGKTFCVPMVIEESSVVAAASSAAKYWMSRGGFKTEILGTQKIGQVHFKWQGDKEKLSVKMNTLKQYLIDGSHDLTKNMTDRGGGINNIRLKDFGNQEPELFQVEVTFETCDSMGANFINSVLERFSDLMKTFFMEQQDFTDDEKDIDIIMSILSNYTPQCLVRAEVSCPVEDLGHFPNGISAEQFAEKFNTALKIASIDPYRATTHNKGIFNGIDAVILATGNDFRAIESCGHSYAARDGQYRSLSYSNIENGVFRFWLEIPLAVGTVGGLTKLHPMAKRSLELLDNPTAESLMRIVACAGLAQNFAAIRSLITTGIQYGHMKMHLQNILSQLGATKKESNRAVAHFAEKTVSYSSVRNYLEQIRTVQA